MEKERQIAWWLATAPGWGAVRLRQLVETLGRPMEIRKAMESSRDEEELYERILRTWEASESFCLGERLRITLQDMARLWEYRSDLERQCLEYHRWTQAGVRFVTAWDAEYPKRLRTIYDYPFALYVRGNLPTESRKTAAVIGARACSGYGAGQGRRLARELAAQNVQIISGLAYGVDSEGHWGALESGVTGATYAVLGCGVEQCYPREHEKLAEKILENGGGLLSEFPPGTKPDAKHFPMRNRIISGLSDCILVMEARKRSGSLITVDQALEQGREVFALPGRVGDSLSEGCHQLIKNGADILTGSEDVLAFLFPGYQQGHQNVKTLAGTGGGKRKEKDLTGKNLVYSCLDCIGKTVEEIMGLTGLPLGEVRMQLLELLMEGQIAETTKGYYSAKI